VRRIGVLSPHDDNDPEARAWLTSFTQGLADLGWGEGRNLRMEIRWAAGSMQRTGEYAKAWVDVQPDVIFVDSTPQTAALQQQTSGHSNRIRGRFRPSGLRLCGRTAASAECCGETGERRSSR
jgi:hypothetical protein